MHRQFDDYTLNGLIALGQAVRYWREAEKPHWRPMVKPNDLEIEQGRWTLDMAKAIIDREYGIRDSRLVTRDQIHALEVPPVRRTEPPLRLLELWAGLNIMLNPATGQPYSFQDLLEIAKENLDWQTGFPIEAQQNSQG